MHLCMPALVTINVSAFTRYALVHELDNYYGIKVAMKSCLLVLFVSIMSDHVKKFYFAYDFADNFRQLSVTARLSSIISGK
jgi:hypothetical protein